MFSIRGDNHANIKFIVDLSSIMFTDLWPVYEYPPPTPDSVAWHVAQLLPKMVCAIHESPTNEYQTHESPTRAYFCKPLEPGATINEFTQEMVVKLSLQRVVQVTPGKGRQKGAKKYTNRHVDILLYCVEDIISCGKMM